jgi:hypothetical protein
MQPQQQGHAAAEGNEAPNSVPTEENSCTFASAERALSNTASKRRLADADEVAFRECMKFSNIKNY